MKKTVIIILLLAATFCMAQAAWAQSGSRFALVIGNAGYQRINKLNNTVNDAEDIAAALRKLGYTVDLKNDVTRPR